MVDRIIVGVFNTNSFLFSEWKKECIIIDPGSEASKIIANMSQKNLTPRGIVCTHGHIDHIAAIREIQTHFADLDIRVPLAVHEKDLHYFGPEAGKIHTDSISGISIELLLNLNIEIHSVPNVDIILSEGETLFGSDLTVIHTPGHSPGGISLYSESQNFLFSGDTLFSEGIGRTDLPGGDAEILIKSIQEKLLNLPDDTRVFPGHGPFSTIEREREHNPFIT
ncbi:MAG: MBL fold metallo-hydrolase [Spirochaetota bacterium]|nr:MBL fold metallo-hydrolase [Spirochaetota bacterium]